MANSTQKIKINKPFISVYSSTDVREDTFRTFTVCNTCKLCKGK